MIKKTVLRTNQVGKYFYNPTRFKVLDGISFDVNEGEFLTLVGKSGCGKSTLLYLLSTMDTDYEGDIEIDGECVTGRSADSLAGLRNSKIGFVFQFHYLLPEFTALRNVMLPALKLRKHSPEEIEHRAIEKLRLLGLDDVAGKPASKLSGGQQQRVAIARALINEPRIIMGDEPTGNLDSRNTEIVFDIFRRLTTDHKQTIVAVTHDNDFARASDRTIEMLDGRIVSHKKLWD